MTGLGFSLLTIFIVVFLAVFCALALGAHLRLFGCHRRDEEKIE